MKKIIKILFMTVLMLGACFTFRTYAETDRMINVYHCDLDNCRMATIHSTHLEAWEREGWSTTFPYAGKIIYYQDKHLLYEKDKRMRVGICHWYDDQRWEYEFEDKRDEIKILKYLKITPFSYNYWKDELEQEKDTDLEIWMYSISLNWKDFFSSPNVTDGDLSVAISKRWVYGMTFASLPYIVCNGSNEIYADGETLIHLEKYGIYYSISTAHGVLLCFDKNGVLTSAIGDR